MENNYLIGGMIAVAVITLCIFAVWKLFSQKDRPDSKGTTPGSGRTEKPNKPTE